jgi:hypothetical protein
MLDAVDHAAGIRQSSRKRREYAHVNPASFSDAHRTCGKLILQVVFQEFRV